MRALAVGVLAVLLALASPALATEGGPLTTSSFGSGEGLVEYWLLCDGSHAASESCAEFNMKAVTTTQRRAPPATIQFGFYRAAAACTPTVTVYGRFETNAIAEAGGTLDQEDHLIVALSRGGTSSMSPAVPALFKVYYATVSADADCTDLEVVLILNYPK